MNCDACFKTGVLITGDTIPVVESNLVCTTPATITLSSGFLVEVLDIQSNNSTIRITNTLDSTINVTRQLFLGTSPSTTVIATLPGPITVTLTVILCNIDCCCCNLRQTATTTNFR